MMSGDLLSGDMLYNALATPVTRGVRLWRLGGAGIAIQSPRLLLYIDPYLAEGGGPGWVRREPPPLTRLQPAQFVLSTHEHDDHADPVALRQLSMNRGCVFVGPPPCVAIARESGFAADRLRQITVGDRLYDDECKITVVPTRDDTAQSPVGYIVQINDVQIYHGGDAQPSEFFAETARRARITCCCLSVGGMAGDEQYYLSPEQAVEAATALGARTLIPVHWDLWTVNSVDASDWPPLMARAAPPEIHLLRPGQYITLDG